MMKTCGKCGRIHARNYICAAQVSKSREPSEADRFRNRQVWKRKAADIKERDMHLCQICVRNLYKTTQKYTSFDLNVHHIVPLAANFDRRLDGTNLITLCRYHHELAERGRIPKAELLAIAAEQEYKRLHGDNSIP